MTKPAPFSEESFGILTDDDLYLDCILIRPSAVDDEHLRAIRAWVPRYPLTKESVLTCARQEVKAFGPKGRIAHLVFDLRGTGRSDGVRGDQNYYRDLHAIADWAKERFGDINFGFLGVPTSDKGRVYMWPLRNEVNMESYYYHAGGQGLTPTTLLYLSTYGSFGRSDDALCTAIAQAGHTVFGVDPLRYLLHASAQGPLTPDDLYQDLRLLIQMLPGEPVVIGQPLAAGLALMWAASSQQIPGVIAIGRAAAGFAPGHIFHNRNPHTYLLQRYMPRIAPRPVALVLHEGHSMGGSEDEINTLFQASKLPNRVERTPQVNADFILELLGWIYAKRGY